LFSKLEKQHFIGVAQRMRILVLEFFIDNTMAEDFAQKRVLEVGSKYVNGSVRPIIEKFYARVNTQLSTPQKSTQFSRRFLAP
jgi:hypothetical protein